MKLDPAQIASEPLSVITLKMPVSVIAAIDHAAALIDLAAPNRSAFVRQAVIEKLLNRQRKASREAA